MDQTAVPATYRSIPTEVTAARWLPDDEQAAGRLLGWIAADFGYSHLDHGGVLEVQTIAGQYARVQPGEWVIAEPRPGRFYPCADDVFRARYRLTADEQPDGTPARELSSAIAALQCACTDDTSCRAHELLEQLTEGS